MADEYKSYRHDRPLLNRLRDHHNLNTPHSNAMQEAADEIERLRAENEQLRKDLKTAIMGDSAELADVKRENEQLRKEIRPYVKLLD